MWSTLSILHRSYWLAHLLLVILTVMLGAEMVQSYRRATRPMPFPLEPVLPASIPDPLPPTAVADYIIAARKLFNPPLPLPPTPQQPPPSDVPTQQAISLQLKLVGTVTSLQGRQYAILEELHTQGAQAVYQMGDAVRQALLVHIRPTCVEFDTRGQSEVLCF